MSFTSKFRDFTLSGERNRSFKPERRYGFEIIEKGFVATFPLFCTEYGCHI